MRKLASVLFLLLAVTANLFAQVGPTSGGGGSVSSGTAIGSCTSSLLYTDASTLLKCDPAAVVNGSVSTAGRSILTIQDTITGASATSNFLSVLGSFNATLTAETSALSVSITGDNDTQKQNAIKAVITGSGPGSDTASSVWAENGTTGTYAVGSYGRATAAATIGVGSIGLSYGATNKIGGYFSLANENPPATSGALVINNAAVAANIFEAQDNGTATSTTAASANVTILDGARVRLGNQVLTSATMTPTIVGEARTVTHSYAWTNAMVTALGAALTGDITVATLPAKTQINNAYVVIDGAAAGPATVTVSCGDAIAGTPFTNYIVASDAKAAANTVYGDAAAERGTSIDVEFYYLPSYTATTLVTCHFISTGANLNTVTGSSGRLILTTTLLP